MFSNRYVRTIILSRVLLQLGIWIRNYAVLLYVTDLTHNNPVYVSLISVAEFAPIFLFGLIGGTFADRWRPKHTMVWSDLLSGLSVGAVLLAVMNGGWIALLIGSFISASLSQFSQPSAMKLYKRHVPAEQLQSVMAMSQTVIAVFTVLGPVIGTFIFMQFGITASLILTAVLFLGSSLVLSSLPRDAEDPKSGDTGGFMQELMAGLRYIGSNPSLRTLCLTFSLVGLASGLTQPLQIFIVIEQLGLEKQSLQWFVMTNGAAMLVGGVAVMGIAKKVKPQLLLTLGLFVASICTIGIGASTMIWLTTVLLAISGLFYPCIHGGIQTLIVRNTKGAFIGRVSGAITPVFMGMMVMGLFISGYLKDMSSLLTVYVVSGGLIIVGAILLLPLIVEKRRKAERGPAS
ncbi:MFS transporter [Aneurinibacillus aneurinilyticus]|uniref:Transporter, major facilitator family protein n=1 Tax=Aneurinibacillus aneurinilyticus ATCC 12856 TaxID=649747 RepID=U1WR64_ANEAE|nr:MFS transporter [Aneurinibacillus aneurinilyticus]ERI11114.1 transporter, major facilitator family protein [Aneurinibacillus aneurinilyticus ATCC 12856]MED0709739.1 MFS transporter [Aneurinibacillus aneurinilyticus]MED0726532.1 MFS transporter [Aneurinibacillus aneurinilyticus]MED0731063.1 MFS transporter [Aneurinibacillus aneurinilyticus]MED0744249.1 MFS transporter [Aneurinibacillus aneurinilyticus]